MLRQRGRANYYFELPVELIDVWGNQYTSNLREAALYLKEDYLKNIAVYTKDGCGFPQAEVLYLSLTFIKQALKDCRHTEQ